MIKDINYYYEEAEANEIDLDKKAQFLMFNPMTEEYKEWSEISTHREYLQKCYRIASTVMIDKLRMEFHHIIAKKDYTELLTFRKKIFFLLKDMENKDLNFKMGFTPITDIRRQLYYLFEDTFPKISYYGTVKKTVKRKPMRQKAKKYLADLFV